MADVMSVIPGGVTIGSLDQHGREVIYATVDEITRDNVAEVVAAALPVHYRNQKSIDYLWRYYKGIQPVLGKTSTTRPEINHIPVENHANEIVTFKTGYLMGSPIQYVKDTTAEKENEDIIRLNSYASNQGRAEKDSMLADWFHICGTGYKMILPNTEDDGSPFIIEIPDPRDTFVIYSAGFGHRPLLGVYISLGADGKILLTCYSRNRSYILECGSMIAPPLSSNVIVTEAQTATIQSSDFVIREEQIHILGEVPIIEYPANMARLGAFEIVIPLLDEINNVLARRADALDRFVEAYMVLTGANVEDSEGFFSNIRELGGVALPEGADLKYIMQELRQDQTQTLADSLYQTVLEICGMPNRQNGVRSTSDNGIAVMYRDGWSTAETHAQRTEGMFKLSEKRFLKIALRICKDIDLDLKDINVHFSRKNYDNVLQKVQALTMMLANDKISPRLAFVHCGLFVDPDGAYEESVTHLADRRRELEEEVRLEIEAETRRSQAQAIDNEEAV